MRDLFFPSHLKSHFFKQTRSYVRCLEQMIEKNIEQLIHFFVEVNSLTSHLLLQGPHASPSNTPETLVPSPIRQKLLPGAKTKLRHIQLTTTALATIVVDYVNAKENNHYSDSDERYSILTKCIYDSTIMKCLTCTYCLIIEAIVQ